ncbi:TIGR01906 family membrane protein [[Clostridium] colinum]|uniref:TIGR01906 family membrane protein n=1 Tax=[Clostridium] colinum TaxID=36835 RepID=UPI0020255B44|nr:TIGR01906 family membrane protein [[Clostridium] colinum]
MKKLSNYILTIFTSILFIYIFIFTAIIFLLSNKYFYYLHIKYLKLVEKTGYSLEEIKLNYNAMLEFLFPFSNKEFHLPTLAYSTQGKIHFEEVKNIFNAMSLICIIILIILAIIIYFYYKKKDSIFLKKCSINCVIIPALLAIICYINFDKYFEIFHKIFFNNDYWIFDTKKDPIINILPQEFFKNCSIVIFIFVLLGSLFLYIIYKFINRKR